MSREYKNTTAEIIYTEYRDSKYTEGARNATPPATIEEFAFAAGCNLIAQTQPGEKYQAPDGSWQTRTSAPPMRDNRCPPAR